DCLIRGVTNQRVGNASGCSAAGMCRSILPGMDSTVVAAGVGAAAGLVTGWGSALITWLATSRSVRVQAEAQRHQWHEENRRESYAAVMTSFRQLMMACGGCVTGAAATGTRLGRCMMTSWPATWRSPRHAPRRSCWPRRRFGRGSIHYVTP